MEQERAAAASQQTFGLPLTAARSHRPQKEGQPEMRMFPATAIATVMMFSVAQAEERMDAYTSCWAETAIAALESAGQLDLEQAVLQAIEKANIDCNGLARHAAETNGKDAVNDMWRYMEVQFANANLREAVE
jgi:hypothetical protein